ncbi:MAG: hypothetical protein V1854_04680 [Methanobacteriota archaeon]
MFDREYLKREMEKLDGLVTARVDLYLIGGGGMSFQNLKDATRDIDIIVRSGINMELIGNALARMGYFVPAIRGPYKQMQASLIMENHDGFRWDIFVNVVCGGLRLSKSMMERAITLFSMERICISYSCRVLTLISFVMKLSNRIEKQLEYLVKKKLVVRNSDGSYSLDLT